MSLSSPVTFKTRSELTKENFDSLSKWTFSVDLASPALMDMVVTCIEDKVVSAVCLVADECGMGKNISVRLAGYSILPEYKGSLFEFSLLPRAVQVCVEQKIKVVYWAHSSLQSYLHDYYAQNSAKEGYYTNTELYRSFEYLNGLRFVDRNSSKKLFVYAKFVEKDFSWRPVASCFTKELQSNGCYQ